MTMPAMTEIGRDEALCPLGGTTLGRIVFTEHALPAIRPVNRLLDNRRIIIRTRAGAACRRRWTGW